MWAWLPTAATFRSQMHRSLQKQAWCAREGASLAGCKSPPGKRSPARNRNQLRRSDAGWGADGGERSARNEVNSFRPL